MTRGVSSVTTSRSAASVSPSRFERIVVRRVYAVDDDFLGFVDQGPEHGEEPRSLRFPMLSEQVGGLGESVWRNENPVDGTEQVDQAVVVLGRVFAQPAVLGDQVSTYAAHDEQHEQIRIDEEPRRGHRPTGQLPRSDP